MPQRCEIIFGRPCSWSSCAILATNNTQSMTSSSVMVATQLNQHEYLGIHTVHNSRLFRNFAPMRSSQPKVGSVGSTEPSPKSLPQLPNYTLCANTRYRQQATRRVVTPRRVPTSSRPAALSATLSRRAVPTRSVPICTVSSAARLVPLRASPTPTPTSRRASPGRKTLCLPTSRTPRSTFLAPRWPLVVSRRRRTGTTSLRK